MRKILFFCLLLPFIGWGQDWEQFGQRLIGEGDLACSVSLSDDAKVIAVGAPRNATAAGLAGKVSVYEYYGPFWVQKGQNLFGESANEFFGASVSTNSDGSILAVSAPGYNAQTGRVRIYEFNGTQWQQLGNDIIGIYSGSTGTTGSDTPVISLSDDGHTVITQNHTEVSVFHYADGDWQQKGQSLPILLTGENGTTLSGNGSVVSIASGGILKNYEYINNSWTQFGADIELIIEKADYDSQLNKSLSLSYDGLTVAVGYPDLPVVGTPDNIIAQIYRYSNDTWNQIGQTVTSQNSDVMGATISLNKDGNVVAVGGFQNSETSYNAGKVIVLKHNPLVNSWEQVGEAIYGEASQDQIGYTISLSGDGTVVAVGAYNSYLRQQPPIFPVWGGFSLAYSNCDALFLHIEDPEEVCAGEAVTINANSLGTVNWYDSADATESVFTGNELVIPELNETTSYWVEAVSEAGAGCTTERKQVTITVNFVPELTIDETAFNLCSGKSITLNAASEGNTVNWYDSEDAEEPVFTGLEYYIPELNETTSYWVQAVNESGCVSERTQISITVSPTPVLTVTETSLEACEFTSITLYATTDTGEVNWYDSEDATEAIFTGNEYTIEQLTETVSYWLQAGTEAGCNSERVEIVVTVLPAPVLSIETTEWAVCSGSEAELFATSSGNVIFWYAHEDDEEYLYHGNLFITEALTETTTFWVEAYNIITGCSSERIEITVTVNPVPDAPIAVSYQTVEEGTTLADLDVEAEGILTWYANETLTVVLPETTLVEENTTYYVTQTIAGCESEATEVSVEFLGLSDINGNSFAVYPNPTSGIVKIQSKTAVANIEVFNISGQRVTSVKAANEVNLSGYPGGTYVIRVILENGEILTRKVIKK